jgi:hypothetical protein
MNSLNLSCNFQQHSMNFTTSVNQNFFFDTLMLKCVKSCNMFNNNIVFSRGDLLNIMIECINPDSIHELQFYDQIK